MLHPLCLNEMMWPARFPGWKSRLKVCLPRLQRIADYVVGHIKRKAPRAVFPPGACSKGEASPLAAPGTSGWHRDRRQKKPASRVRRAITATKMTLPANMTAGNGSNHCQQMCMTWGAFQRPRAILTI